MKIIVKNKLVSWGGSSTVQDEAGKDLYRVKGKILSLSKKKKLVDMSCNVLYCIRNKVPTLIRHSAFICDKNGKKICKVARDVSIRSNYTVEGLGDNITVKGSLTGSSMEVRVNGEIIGSIRNEFFSLTDCFVIDTVDGQDPTFLVALVVAIDNIRDNARGQSK